METPTLIALAALAGASIAGGQTPAQSQTQFKILTLQMANYVGININHLTIQNGRSDNSGPNFFNPSVGIDFYGADSSSINNCTFRGYDGEGWGIVNNYSHGGNSYANDTFINIHPIEVIHPAYNSNGPVAVLNHMDWAPASK